MLRNQESFIPRELLSTYRYLRMAMPLLAVMLGTSVLLQIYEPAGNCWLSSISAYYYTAARAVFVACLCAIGTCLIVYRGTGREDMALNISGALAFMVALIPTPLKPLLAADPHEPLCARFNQPSESQFAASLDNNVKAALIAATAVAALTVLLRLLLPDQRGSGRPGLGLTIGAPVAVALGWWIFLSNPQWVRDHGHEWSARLLFAGIAVMIVMNVWPRLAGQHADGPWTWHRWVYLVIFILMAAAALILGLATAHEWLYNALFWLEGSLIALFMVFWVVQTAEHWNPRPANESVATQA
jgi:uncharacterized membrane protein SirB2